MKRIVDFDVSAEHYTVDAVVVWCFDRRFECLETGVKDYYGFKTVDPVYVAGGAKDLVSGSTYSRNYLLNQIHAAIKFHDARNVVLMTHANCAAYGKQFVDNDEAEVAFYRGELNRAEEVVERFLKKNGLREDVRIIKVYADFKGAFEV
ncbi:MAG: hypothetical protein HY225_02875 [Candidatus Vogelbacteria bacterium]|nr:hypothetical protein [Candidatus Vogelbacteria bacterium]